MKIIYEKDLPSGKLEGKLCICKGPDSSCQDKARPVRTFENKGKLAIFKKSFHING
jgi:hypothetical protein